jgi:HEAT repeat protein
MKDKETCVRDAVAEALGAIGLDAKDAGPVLLEALNDPNPFVRKAAATALKKIEPQAVSINRKD